MSQAKVDTITDQAGTGAPDFSQGMTISGGGDTLDTYEEGTWTGAYQADANLTGTPVTFTTMTYTRIGNTVFARAFVSNSVTQTSTATRTWFTFSTTGLPGVVNATAFSGAGHVTVNAIDTTASVAAESAGNTNLFISWNPTESGSCSLSSIDFSYTI